MAARIVRARMGTYPETRYRRISAVMDPQHSRPPDIGFLFIGGMHQAPHIAPLALALARRGAVVTAYTTARDAEPLAALLADLDPAYASRVRIVPIAVPRWARAVRRLLFGRQRLAKPLELIAGRRQMLRHDALVATERTSTLLKRLPGAKPVMVHFPHGAGDRAQGFDRRIALFDHVLVAGPAIMERTLREGLAHPGNIKVVGSIKLAALAAPDRPPPPNPFADTRPVILYNPHFDAALSSWPMAEAIVDRIVADGRFNLIVGPHARLHRRLTAAERRRWDGRRGTANLLIDFESHRLSDMSYTRLADIYLGDISSQVYEFLLRPRPCVFVNAHDAAWWGNPDYRMWTLGDVCTTPGEVMQALAQAQERHARYRGPQEAEAAATLGPIDPGVPDRAAQAMLDALAPTAQA